MGRRLKTINGNGNTISYKYNDSGIRTEKTVNGVTTKYSLVGDKVTFENNGSDKLYYTYDSNGKLLSMNVTSPTNILEGSSDIGIMDQSPNNAGITIGEFTNPKTNNKVKAIRLNKDASIPNIWSPYIGLKTNTNYVLEFDYWADADDVKFDVDLFLDDLPQSFPIAKKTVQRYKWEFSSPSVNMTATMLRFFNDTVQVNPANIYISNIKLYESSKANETSKEYFYVRNAQSDIIGLVNAAGEQVVSYLYDTWGKLVSISGSLSGSIGEVNPYRYRGYRYDTETGLYYVQSRYYNPEWGRSINIDALFGEVGDILSHNLFAYCTNNPINMKDSNGFRPVYTTDIDMETDAMQQYSFSKMKDLGYMKWKYRRDPADDSTRENEHVHLEGDGKKYQQDVYGKRRTKGNTGGEPPRRAKEALKEKEGWDWDANASKAKKITAGSGVLIGGGYVTYRVVRMIPSLLPPLWPTIPANLTIP